jgi:bifunctional pyridoxal-dependent enzyme with beta-cystathionase and maltose regulon repressor activities
MELAAIWLDKPVVTNEGKTVRLCKEQQVLVVNDEIVDMVDEPSHQVLKVFGKSNSDFSILLVNLCTFDLLTIKLP